ncbi:MAG: ABC transporter permease, partial [Allorhizobium sp.]
MNGYLVFAFIFWLGAWGLNEWLVRRRPKDQTAKRAIGLAVPLIFGVTLRVIWECMVRGFE